MNRMIRSLALVLVMVMCIGMFTACSNGSDETQNTTPSTTGPAPTLKPAQDIVGLVKEVSSSFIKLELYAIEGDIDYETLDVNTLTSTGETDYIYISSTAKFSYVSEGKLVTLKTNEMEVGHVVEMVETAKGMQQFVILNYADSTEPTTPVTEPVTE